MIGNDIIDIKEAKRSSNWERKGFMQKVFTVNEQRIITTSTNPFTVVWRLWSMKESAYKIYIQAGGDRFFNPTKFECTLYSLQNGQVKMNTTIFKTSTSINSNYIFSTATINNNDLDTCIFSLKQNNGAFQSNFMQHQVLNNFAEKNSLHFSELLIKKTETGVPTLFYKNKPLNTSISISHHGYYGAYTILKN